MWPAFPTADYYGSSATLSGVGRRRAFPEGTATALPMFTVESFDGRGAQLCPCSIATDTPQSFTVASRSTLQTDPGVLRAHGRGSALPPGPYPSGWSR
jgi:hypothetical protein